MLRYKKDTKILISSCLFFLLFISCISFFGDANCLFYRKNKTIKIAQLLVSGEAVSNILDLNERKMQIAFSEINRDKIDILILGSSRSMGLSQGLFKGHRTWNGSVSGATLQDIIAFYSIHTKSTDISTLIIGIDPWIFNKNNGLDRWKIVSDQYNDFMKSGEPKKDKETFKTLINTGYFYLSLKNLLKKDEIEIVSNEDIYSYPTDIILPDGSRIYGTNTRNKTEEEVDQLAQVYAKANPIYALGEFEKIDNELKNAFIFFVNRLTQAGINIYFWVPPYHPIVYKEIKKSEKYKIALEVEDFIKKISKAYNVPIIGSYNPFNIGASSELFIDGMHLNYKGYAKIFKNKELLFQK